MDGQHVARGELSFPTENGSIRWRGMLPRVLRPAAVMMERAA